MAPTNTPETPTPTPATSPMCEPCAGVQQNWRRARGHAELVQGTHRTVAHKYGLVTITRYRCERCGTAWDYENNKVNRHAGWSVVPGVAGN